MRSSSVSSTAGQFFANRRATASMNVPSPAPISRMRSAVSRTCLRSSPAMIGR